MKPNFTFGSTPFSKYVKFSWSIENECKTVCTHEMITMLDFFNDIFKSSFFWVYISVRRRLLLDVPR